MLWLSLLRLFKCALLYKYIISNDDLFWILVAEQCRQEFAAIQVSKPDSEKGYSSELVTILAVACGFIGFILLLTLFYICKQKYVLIDWLL